MTLNRATPFEWTQTFDNSPATNKNTPRHDTNTKVSYLRLVVWHMLHKRLIRELLRAIGNILSWISWWCRNNRRAGCWCGMHHGALMMLVLPLLWHIWYYKARKTSCETCGSRTAMYLNTLTTSFNHAFYKQVTDMSLNKNGVTAFP